MKIEDAMSRFSACASKASTEEKICCLAEIVLKLFEDNEIMHLSY